MNRVSRYVEAGRFGRSHALKGEVRLLVKPGFSDWVEEGRLFYLSPPSGDRIPARFVTVRKGMEDRSDSSLFFVQIDRVTSREQADALRDTPFLVERTEETSRLSEVVGSTEEVVGFDVFIEDGGETRLFGKVIERVSGPAHPILRIEHSRGEVLVPEVDAFILSTDVKHRRVVGRDLDALILDEEE